MRRRIGMIGVGLSILIGVLVAVFPRTAEAQREIDVVQCYCNGQYTVMPQGTNCQAWCMGNSGGGGGYIPPTVHQPTPEEIAAQARAAKWAAFNDAYARAGTIAKNGFALSDRGDYAAAIKLFRQAQALLRPYQDEAYTTFTETDLSHLLDGLKHYIGFCEAHIAEASGDLDLALRDMQMCNGMPFPACLSFYMRDYYIDLDKRVTARNNFAKNKADTERMIAEISRKPEPVPAPVPTPGNFKPSGNALIGGTTWITGYNVPPGSTPELKKRAAEMLRQQMKLADIPYSEAIDFTRYNFVLGIGASTDAFTDLRKRVLFDNLMAGQATAELQSAYSALKGRSFDELGCHSNGAMICLAALENRDIRADRVVLYGPQITPESLRMWESLIKEKRIKSVQIYLHQNDPVPAVSMMFGASSVAEGLASVALFKTDVMKWAVHETAPSISVKTFACGGSVPTLDCHDLTSYKYERGCLPTPATKADAPKLPIGNGLFEPPPPTCY